jgi:hypothetical protein
MVLKGPFQPRREKVLVEERRFSAASDPTGEVGFSPGGKSLSSKPICETSPVILPLAEFPTRTVTGAAATPTSSVRIARRPGYPFSPSLRLNRLK